MVSIIPHYQIIRSHFYYDMSIVVPGQYLEPEFKPNQEGTENEFCRFFPGRGATISSIKVGSHSLPVVVATLLGKKVIQELKVEEDNNNDVKEEKDGNNGKDERVQKLNSKMRNFLVSVAAGKQSQYSEYATEIEASATESVRATATNLPREGDVVLVRITRLQLKQAHCEVLSVYGHGNVSSDGGVGSNGRVAHLSVPMGGGSQILSSYAAVASSQNAMAGAQPMDIGEAYRGIIRTQDVRSTERDKVKIVDCFKPGDLVKAVVLSLGDGSNYYLTTARNDLGVVFAKSEGGAGDLMTPIDWETMVCEKTGIVEKRKCANLFQSSTSSE